MSSSKSPEPERRGPKISRNKWRHAPARKTVSLGGAVLDAQKSETSKPGLLHFTLTVLYKNLYLLGITLLRRRLRIRRKIKARFHSFSKSVLGLAGRVGGAIKRYFSKIWSSVKAPFFNIGRTYREVRPAIMSKRAKGKLPLTEYLAVLEAVGRLIFKIFATIFNYTAPVATAIIFVVIVQRTVNESTIWTVSYDGQAIGYIENRSEYSAATQDVRSRLTTDGAAAFEIVEPQFELLTISQFEQRKDAGDIPKDADLLDRADLADILMRRSGGEVVEAYGLYIDNQFLGAVREKDPVLNEFDEIKRSNLTGKPDETIQFVKSVKLKPGLFPKSSVVEEDSVLNIISGHETSDEIYIVKDNDTPTGIAEKTGVPYETLKSLNPDIETSLVAGMEIYTQIARPFMSVESTYTDVVVEDVPFDTVEVENGTYARGYREVFQEGVDGSRRVTYQVRSVDGQERDRAEVSAVILKHPVVERVTIGINDPQTIWTPPVITAPNRGSGSASPPPAVQAPVQAAPSAGFIWPVGGSGGTISCYLNGYWGHTGIDISRAGGSGTPILASAGGTVVLAKNGWTGYGRHIIIDHGNGYQTLYAHNTSLYVNVGDRVAPGQVIAAMGQTGNAYGVHLHFEVRYNGRIMNPVNYVGRR